MQAALQASLVDARGSPAEKCSYPGCSHAGSGINLEPCRRCNRPAAVHHLCAIQFVGPAYEEELRDVVGAECTKWCYKCLTEVRLLCYYGC